MSAGLRIRFSEIAQQNDASALACGAVIQHCCQVLDIVLTAVFIDCVGQEDAFLADALAKERNLWHALAWHIVDYAVVAQTL